MAMEIRLATTIRRPRTEVAAVLFDPAHDPEWTAGLLEVHPSAPGPLVQGMVVERVHAAFRREVVDQQDVLAATPERSAVLRRFHPYPLVLRYDLERIPEGTLVRLRVLTEVHWLRRLLGPGMKRRFRSRWLRDLTTLKDLLESRSEAAVMMPTPGEPGEKPRSLAG